MAVLRKQPRIIRCGLRFICQILLFVVFTGHGVFRTLMNTAPHLYLGDPAQ